MNCAWIGVNVERVINCSLFSDTFGFGYYLIFEAI